MIWAAIDILDGQCVQLKGGDPATARFARDPFEAAAYWTKQGADGLHIVDLNNALGTGTHRDLIEKILNGAKIPTQVGGGIREMHEIESWLKLGASRVIIGTKAIADPDWLGEICSIFPHKIILALDTKDDKIATHGWTQCSGIELVEFARKVEELPLAGLLYTNINVEGSESGIERHSVSALCEAVNTPVMISGGIGSEADVNAALELGAESVVVGTALYSGKIRLESFRQEQTHA